VKQEQVHSDAAVAPIDSQSPAERERVKIACVGDSITWGMFVWRRKRNSYPAQLQGMLGERFCVRNFGVNARAIQKTADQPYWSSRAFTLSSAFEPDIVLIMLGTNDSRGDNWKGVLPFSADYHKLVAHYRLLESSPRVYLLTPPALFRVGRSARVRYGMSEVAIQEICGAIKNLAHELGCDVIDIHAATVRHPEAFRFDGVHPGKVGATLIAQAAYGALTGTETGPQESDIHRLDARRYQRESNATAR
jgi:lysophospholipase L1-like esterase